jgi:hypothetical protein
VGIGAHFCKWMYWEVQEGACCSVLDGLSVVERGGGLIVGPCLPLALVYILSLLCFSTYLHLRRASWP